MVFDQVKEVLADQLSVEASQITMETNIIEDLGADSLDLVELLTTLEDSFNLVITDESIHDLQTVGEIVSLLESLV